LVKLFTPHQAKTPCNLCHSEKTWIIGEVDRHNQPLRTVLCQSCGLGWTDPQPESSTIQKFYERDYRKQYKGTFKPKKKHTYRAGRVAARRWNQLKKFLNQDRELLDLGSGGGEFVYLMRSLGLNAIGIEPNEGYAAYARDDLGLPIQEGFISDQLTIDRPLDVITMFHVLEHLQDPVAMVGLLSTHLKEGGHLVIEVPNLETTCHYPGNCYHFAHLYHFNAETLTFLGELNGMQCVFVDHSNGDDNVTVVLQKDSSFTATLKDRSSNAKKIYDILRSHTFFKHVLKPKTHLKTIAKQFRQVQELVTVSRFTDQKEALDKSF